MKILGIVTEYNPFHNGHKYHIEKSKELTGSDAVVAVMSGNFMQRGEPAIMDKWTRAASAVSSGVDLVIELPTVFALNSAEYFGYGACYILNHLGVIDSLVFGSEDGNIDAVKNISHLLMNSKEDISKIIAKHMSDGHSFPKAREMAIVELNTNKNDLNLSKPNNILGIEYFKALLHLNSKIQVDTVKRISSDYNDQNLKSEISSATAIRKHILEEGILDDIKSNVPPSTFGALSKAEKYVSIDNLSTILISILRRSNPEEIAMIHDVSEGLENKILFEANNTDDINELIDRLKSKRYTRTRIQRILLKILLNIKDDYIGKSFELSPSYVRILAFNDKGREIIKIAKKASELPIITNLDRLENYPDEVRDMLTYDVRGTNMYAMISNIKPNSDFRTRPVYIKTTT